MSHRAGILGDEGRENISRIRGGDELVVQWDPIRPRYKCVLWWRGSLGLEVSTAGKWKCLAIGE